jgi:hypothetical protein
VNRKLLVAFLCAVAGLNTAASTAVAQEEKQEQKKAPKLRAYTIVKPAAVDMESIKRELAQTGSSSKTPLPLFTYRVESTRDLRNYTGVMVGRNPFTGGGDKEVSVLTHIVPLIIVTNTIGASFDPTTGIITTAPGVTTFDPTVADTACMTAPNDVPATVFAQSPIFNSASFSFGGTHVGTTQYIDAFQRGNFWTELGHHGIRGEYHTKLDAVSLAAIVVNVPAKFGTTLPSSSFPSCGPLGIIDINWFDKYLTETIIPALSAQGVNPSNFPLFQLYNVVMAAPVTNLASCCVLGYHGTDGFPIQTYSPTDFDTTGLFGPGISDTSITAHEVGEWANDPFGNNAVPAWGHIGQQGGCQGNLEVGDPLTGTNAPPVVMPNGFNYHLQELVFFSWFFGTPSIGVNSWFSDNGTFLTDAGPPCH